MATAIDRTRSTYRPMEKVILREIDRRSPEDIGNEQRRGEGPPESLYL